MTERYRGRVAIVTGGTTGIGRGIVERLVSEGASVVTCARHAPESPLPDGATFIAADITDEATVASVIDAAVDRYGRLDVLVANAGGVNPAACAAAFERMAAEAGVKLKVAYVAGDDLLDRADELSGQTEMFTGER